MTDQSIPNPPKDTLLKAGKFLAVILQIVVALAAAAMAAALVAVLFNPGEIASELAKNGSDTNLSAIIALITVMLLSAIAVVASAFYFFRLLGRIIDTVGEGEPFVVINAQRLNRMGWITLIFQLASIPIGAMASYIAAQFPHYDVTADIEFSLTGILMALVLFILARVFLKGAEMRDDLEGTV